MQALSSSNVQGGIAGLAATFALSALTHAGYIALAAGVLGLPEATVAAAAAGIISIVVKVAVTHISELQSADEILKTLESVKTYSAPSDFPLAPPAQTTTSNINEVPK